MSTALQVNLNVYWVTPVIEVINPDHAAIKDALVAFAYDSERKTGGGVASGVAPHAKSGLYESPFDLFQSTVPAVRALQEFCGRAVGQTVMNLNQQLNRGQLPLDGVAVDLFESWLHVTRDGGFHDVHTHPNCSWCGIYYVANGEASAANRNGVNRFYPPISQSYSDVGTQVLSFSPIEPAPVEGKLILFPSYVRHAAHPYHGASDRIVAAFNAKVFRRPAG